MHQSSSSSAQTTLPREKKREKKKKKIRAERGRQLPVNAAVSDVNIREFKVHGDSEDSVIDMQRSIGFFRVDILYAYYVDGGGWMVKKLKKRRGPTSSPDYTRPALTSISAGSDRHRQGFKLPGSPGSPGVHCKGQGYAQTMGNGCEWGTRSRLHSQHHLVTPCVSFTDKTKRLSWPWTWTWDLPLASSAPSLSSSSSSSSLFLTDHP